MEPKILAFIGAGCVGKSTLLEAYRRKYDGDRRIAFADEAAKQYFASHRMPEELRFTAPVQGEIQMMAMSVEEEACRRGQVVLADRSTLDYPIYVSAIGDAVGAAALLDRARPWMRMYRRLYLLDPAGVPFEQTAERQENEEMRQVLHSEYLRFLEMHDIPFTLLTGVVETRMRTVDIVLLDLLS